MTFGEMSSNMDMPFMTVGCVFILANTADVIVSHSLRVSPPKPSRHKELMTPRSYTLEIGNAITNKYIIGGIELLLA